MCCRVSVLLMGDFKMLKEGIRKRTKGRMDQINGFTFFSRTECEINLAMEMENVEICLHL